MILRSALLSLAAATLLASAIRCKADEVFPVIHTGTITIQLVRGADGKPWAHQPVVLRGGYDRRDLELSLWRVDAVTDDAGRVELSNGLRNLPWLRLETPAAVPCGSEVAVNSFSVELIRRDGLTGPNRCGAITAPNSAGVLTLYLAEKIPVLRALETKAHLRRKPKAQPEPGRQAKADPVQPAPQPVSLAGARTAEPLQATAAPPLTDAELEQLLAGQP